MLVTECMKRDPVTVKMDDSFRYALKLIREGGNSAPSGVGRQTRGGHRH